ncbi:MAG TPA: hypothetical protein ENN63_06595 [Bacteroidetes bacterium]|nr:hypothetical protein [Bacteroidota bacterium]
MTLLIFTENPSPRLDYAAGYLLGELLGLKIRITYDATEFRRATGPRLNYSSREFPGVPGMVPHELLYRKGKGKTDIHVEKNEGIPCFFRTSESGPLPYDLLASTFWMISRYEEYRPETTDEHGRFPAAASLAYRHGFLGMPVVSYWSELLAGVLRRDFPEIGFRKPAAAFLATLDIDIAWAYKYRRWWRVLGASVKDLTTWQPDVFAERLLVLTGFREDPYDVYEWLEGIHRKFDRNPVYFFLVGDYGRHDKNISPLHPAMIHLIRDRMSNARVGLHPSFHAAGTPGVFRKEKNRLEKITGKPVISSRQHYLKISFPDTFRMLEEAGVRYDFSLGFPEEPGFRAGTAVPFRFYDLAREKPGRLTLVPMTLMDGTLCEYLHLKPEQAMSIIHRLLDEVKSRGGNFVSLWHNHSLSERGLWKGWRKVYTELMEAGSKLAHDQISQEQ